ncbi:hypothetical protein HYFRA_00003297 [Hymenoscyphus fraxineus]|uniref:endo-polygalacturonase n=1 Tax=Hymenoscyphus fraxineus TaxID=746836 RepID=A0A9N9KU39_9HELO|nr:hypothetical protein HYFRA_00003297 [Hymenoscyphus fraxineus]
MHSPSIQVFVALVLAATSVVAAPAPAPTAAPSPWEIEEALKERAVEKRADKCTFSGAKGYSLASKSKASCSTIILDSLKVPAGKTLDLTKLPDNTDIIFEGETSFAYHEWEGPLFSVSGKGITVAGTSGATLNGNGPSYWDGKGGSGGVKKPKFFQAHDLTDSLIEQITILNPPVQVFSINKVKNLVVAYVTVDASAGDAKAKNTDAFDIGSSDGVTIKGAKVYNQDDCVAVNSGSNILFTGGLCSGGHGLSIGSVGGRKDNIVEKVSFTDSTVTKSVQGKYFQTIRVKARAGETGAIKSVIYSGITMSSISKYGVLIEQNYNGGDLHGTATSDLPITGLVLKNIKGSGAVASKGYNVVVTCGSSSSCSNWSWSGVAISGGKKYASCTNVPSITSCY